MRSKKGSWVGFALHPVFETLVAVTLMIALLYFINNLDEKTSFEKRFLATDLSLLIDSIPAMPQEGNLYLLYNPQHSPKFSKEFGFDFKKGSVVVSAGSADKKPEVSYFTPDPAISIKENNMPYAQKLVYPSMILRGSTLYFDDINRKSVSYTPDILTCGSEKVAGRVLASASHTKDPELTIESGIAAAVNGQFASAQGKEIPVSIKVGNSPAGEVYVKARVYGDNDPVLLAQSRRLACEIINSVMLRWEEDGFDVIGTAVIPINPELTASIDDDFLKKGDAGVLIELGTMNEPGLFDVSKLTGTAVEIGNGVRNAA